jgi:hypothetical protein
MESLHSSTETKEEKTDEPYLPELMHVRYTSTLNQKKKLKKKRKEGGKKRRVPQSRALYMCPADESRNADCCVTLR